MELDYKAIIILIILLLTLKSSFAVDMISVTNDDVSDIDFILTDLMFLECQTSYTCGSWTACNFNSQNRTCTDTLLCGADIVESQYCYSGFPSSGGGSSGSPPSQNYPDCPEGFFDSVCYCGSSSYSYGYCYDGVYHSEPINQNITIPESNDTVIVSNVIDNMYFTIYSDKYSYDKGEDIRLKVEVYKDNQLVDADEVGFYIMLSGIDYGNYILKNIGTGIYEIFFDNNLDTATYDFRFYVKEGTANLVQGKAVSVSENSELLNRLYTPSGNINLIYIVPIVVIIIILIYLVVRRKSKK